MKPTQAQRFSSLIRRLHGRNFPSAIHLACESGYPASDEPFLIIDSPRLSICLRGTGSYWIMKNGSPFVATISPGEALVAMPNCVMESHQDADYLSLGIVFDAHVMRFLLARKSPGPKILTHRILAEHQSEAMLDPDVKHFFQALENASQRERDDPYLRHLTQVILLKATEIAGTATTPANPCKAYHTWQAACRFIHENMHHPMGREDVARFLKLHPNHISRLFNRFGEHSFNAYLTQARLQRARKLLENPALNVGDVAKACGFSDPNYFIRSYRRTHGLPPGKSRATIPPVG